jgi:hypothetical protein
MLAFAQPLAIPTVNLPREKYRTVRGVYPLALRYSRDVACNTTGIGAWGGSGFMRGER